jgi:hypothetical protein
MIGDQVSWAWEGHFPNHLELCRIDNNHFRRFTHADKIAVILGIDGDTLSVPGGDALDQLGSYNVDDIQRAVSRVAGQETIARRINLDKIKLPLRARHFHWVSWSQGICRRNEARYDKER